MGTLLKYPILRFFVQLLQSMTQLEEELTSDEPGENAGASSSVQSRQKQEKEEIINGAEILQEEGQRIIDDLSLVSWTYDRLRVSSLLMTLAVCIGSHVNAY